MKSDQGTNVRFVQTVQAYPCLYDHSTKDYSNRNAQDKAWTEIGKKFDTTSKKNQFIYFTRQHSFNLLDQY